jgi:hypothetical protein
MARRSSVSVKKVMELGGVWGQAAVVVISNKNKSVAFRILTSVRNDLELMGISPGA